MLHFRFAYRLITTFFSRFKLIIFAGILVGIAFFFFLNKVGPSLIIRKSERIGIVGRYDLNNLPDSVLELVSSGLTVIDDNGTALPGISSRWETNDNGKTWIFHLNEEKTWQDGKKITSQSLQFSFSDVQVEKPDSNTVIFKLQSAFAPFPVIVSAPLFKKGLLGNGEFKINKVTVSANTAEKISMTDSNKNRKTFYFYPTEERAKLALKLGQITSLSEIFNPEPFLDSWKTIQIDKNTDLDKYVAIFFNTDKNHITADKSLRQALAYAINKEKFKEVAEKKEARAISPISPNSWAYNPQVKQYAFDPVRATELIKSLPKDTKDKLNLKLATTSVLLEEADIIAKNWEEVGVSTSIQVTQGIPEEFDTFLAIFDIPKDPDQYALWHSNQDATNISNFSNPRIDKLLEDGRTQIDLETRKKIYLDFQRFLLEEAPAVFLYHPTLYTISKKP